MPASYRSPAPAGARAPLLLALILALTALAPASAAGAQAVQPSSPPAAVATASAVDPNLQAALDAALVRARRKGGTSGLAVAVVAQDGRSWTDASGVDGDGVALSQHDAHTIGSVTKTFTAALVLALVDEGRIELDAPANRYLPKVRLVRGVTVRQLLTHTSGIADLYRSVRSRLSDAPGGRMSSNDVLGSIGARWFAPGTGYAYSNTNYFLLGHIIEVVTHRPFAAELQDRFAGPLGLEQTRLLTDADPRLPAAWASAFWTSGAMVATPLELATWGQALYRGRVLSRTSTARMLDFNSGHDYGHGAQLFSIAGRALPGHSGLLYSTTTLLVHLPAERVTVALSSPQPGANLERSLNGSFGGPSLLEVIRQLAG